jgi:hypothetical protein
MRSELGKELRRQFHALMRRKLPQFHRVKPKEIDAPWGGKTTEIPHGDRLYLWEHSTALYFYLELSIDPKCDSFTIGCAWTRNKRFPALVGSMFPRGVPKSDIPPQGAENGDMRFRLGTLFPNAQDYWWEVAKCLVEEVDEWIVSGEWRETDKPEILIEDALRNVEPCVEDAVNKIIKYVIPYFEEVVQKYKL